MIKLSSLLTEAMSRGGTIVDSFLISQIMRMKLRVIMMEKILFQLKLNAMVHLQMVKHMKKLKFVMDKNLMIILVFTIINLVKILLVKKIIKKNMTLA